MNSAHSAPQDSDSLLIPADQMKETFFRILKKLNFKEEKAESLAETFMKNSLDGVYSHGVNRFPTFVEYVKSGYIHVDAEPERSASGGAIEQWNGKLGPGPLNALKCTERAMELARENGLGCVAISNTNHWMRGGTYGWKAAKEGFVFIGWTNTLANMPAWGAVENKIGNNPLVMAVPYQDEAIVLDMAMSQFSYGSLEAHELNKEELPFPGGYNKEGKLTKNAAEVQETGRVLPTGYWKGSGLSLLLDILAALLSGGLPTAEISKKEAEYGVSQVYIAINTSRLSNASSIPQLVKNIIDDFHASDTASGNKKVRYPGEGSLDRRKENQEKGIPVNKNVWEKISNFL